MPTDTIEKVIEKATKCDECNTANKDLNTIDGEKLCDDCIAQCEDCQAYVNKNNIESVFSGERRVCSICVNDYRTCEMCDTQYHVDGSDWEQGIDGHCANCSDDEDEFPFRDWKKDKKLEVFKKGVFMQTDRLFGVEIEAQFSSERVVREVSKNINENIGITTDAGAEFQTPPSCGYEGERMIKQLTYRLRKHKFTVPDNCGFHLHVDAHDMDTRSIKNLWLLYIVFDDVIRSFINSYRKSSSWCHPTKDKFDEVMECATQDDLERLYYGMFTSRKPQEITDSYLKDLKRDRKAVHRNGFNLQCVFAEKHLEIRYHESTLSGKRVLEWANLHCLIMDLAKQGFEEEWIERMHDRKIGKMSELFAKLGLAPSSCHYWKNVNRNLK